MKTAALSLVLISGIALANDGRVVDAGWFTSQGAERRTSDAHLPVRVVVEGSGPVALVAAEVLLSSRYRVTVPLWVAE